MQASFVAVFTDLTTNALEFGVADQPEHLWQRYVSGDDIEADLVPRGVTLAELLGLVRLWQVAKTGTVRDDEWTEWYDILLSVTKRRLFPEWISQEAGQVTVSDEFFQRAAARPTPIPWRTNPRRRRNWERRLSGRQAQLDTLLASHAAMVDDTEAATLPILRDALIQGLDRQGYADVDLADWLTRRLAISFAYDGSQRLSRTEQAVQTLQEALIDVRSGRLQTVGTMPLGSPAPRWDLKLPAASGGPPPSAADAAARFDAEWRWMGDFATWRGAMTAIAYPENLLYPSLSRSPTRTAAFGTLVGRLRLDRRLTPAGAEEAAAAYIEDLRAEVPTANPSLSLTSSLDEAALLQRRVQSRNLLLPLDPNPNTGGLDLTKPHYLREVFFLAPMLIAQALQRAGQYLAALDWYRTVYAYDLAPGGPEDRLRPRGRGVAGQLVRPSRRLAAGGPGRPRHRRCTHERLDPLHPDEHRALSSRVCRRRVHP